MTDRLRAVFVLPNCRAPDLSRYRRRTSAACPGSRMRPITLVGSDRLECRMKAITHLII
jgi:hypothetical protein